MPTQTIVRHAIRWCALASLAGLAACGSTGSKKQARYDRECMARAMYFESNRSSDEGMLAVGTVVMNRLQSGKYPATVCGVVGQKRQFAPGVLSKPMAEGKSRERAYRNADLVLRGKRHRGVANAMFFHTAGYNFPYTNMHYKVIAGGNAFYEKRKAAAGRRNTTQIEVARGGWGRDNRADAETVQVAAARPASRAKMRRAPPPAQQPTATAFAEPAPTPATAGSIEDLILASGG